MCVASYAVLHNAGYALYEAIILAFLDIWILDSKHPAFDKVIWDVTPFWCSLCTFFSLSVSSLFRSRSDTCHSPSAATMSSGNELGPGDARSSSGSSGNGSVSGSVNGNSVVEGIELEDVNADEINEELPEPGGVVSQVQHALAALCFEARPGSFIYPRMLKVLLSHVMPDQYQCKANDTLLATLLTKRFSIKKLLCRDAVGNTEPSKHETGYGVEYRHLAIIPPSSRYATDRSFAEESEEQKRLHYQTLKKYVAAPLASMDWDHALILKWFKESGVKQKGKKPPSPHNLIFPPLSFIMLKFDVLRVVLNYPGVDQITASVLSPKLACIRGEHVPETGNMEGNEDISVWEEGPCGPFKREIPAPADQWFDTSVAPTYHPHGYFWGVEFPLLRAPPVDQPAPKRAKLTAMQLWMSTTHKDVQAPEA